MWSSTVSYGTADIYKSQLHTLMSKYTLATIILWTIHIHELKLGSKMCKNWLNSTKISTTNNSNLKVWINNVAHNIVLTHSTHRCTYSHTHACTRICTDTHRYRYRHTQTQTYKLLHRQPCTHKHSQALTRTRFKIHSWCLGSNSGGTSSSSRWVLLIGSRDTSWQGMISTVNSVMGII